MTFPLFFLLVKYLLQHSILLDPQFYIIGVRVPIINLLIFIINSILRQSLLLKVAAWYSFLALLIIWICHQLSWDLMVEFGTILLLFLKIWNFRGFIWVWRIWYILGGPTISVLGRISVSWSKWTINCWSGWSWLDWRSSIFKWLIQIVVKFDRWWRNCEGHAVTRWGVSNGCDTCLGLLSIIDRVHYSCIGNIFKWDAVICLLLAIFITNQGVLACLMSRRF